MKLFRCRITNTEGLSRVYGITAMTRKAAADGFMKWIAHQDQIDQDDDWSGYCCVMVAPDLRTRVDASWYLARGYTIMKEMEL